jgi:hypothetical protein
MFQAWKNVNTTRGRRRKSPHPANFSKAARPASEGQDTVPEEDTSLDEMRETTKDLMAHLAPG